MKEYKNDNLQEIIFPLAGIGTGGVGLSGTGALVDWELEGRPNKWSLNEYSNFAIKAEQDGKVVDARVLMGDMTRNLSGNPYYAHHQSWGYGNGINRATLAGMPHFENTVFYGGFPFAEIEYSEPKLPAEVRLTAFNPFIPGDEDNSSLPAAYFIWTLKNTSDKITDFSLAMSVGNTFRTSDGGTDTFSCSDGISSILLSSRNYTSDDRKYGELRISTDCRDVSYQEYWYRSAWFDDLTVFWREFTAPGRLCNRQYDDDDRHGKLDIGDMATLVAHVTLRPGEMKDIRFVMTWYYPNFEKYWDGAKPVWKHEYCRRFGSSDEVKDYCFSNFEYLYSRSKQFQDAMLSVTIPDACTEAALFNLEVLKSPTCLRLENGDFWAFEGVTATAGSCEGTCDHVWGYQYALAYLFPRFARRILEIDFDYNMKDSGEMMFRTMIPLGSAKWNFRACVDGQMGCIIRFYREWKQSGDDEWLRKYWEKIKKALEYAWSPDNYDKWDPGKTGVISGRQHHTLDVELFGPNPWLTGFYLAALKATSEMAAYLGEKDKAAEYAELFEKGYVYVDKELFNGKRYIQKVDVSDRSLLDPYAEHDPNVYSAYWNDEKKEIKYQIGEGSDIDQMLSQFHATAMGIGDVFDPDHRKTAAKTLYDTNFKSMRDVPNPCRIFAANGEKGLIICEWDEDSYRPQIPIPYSEECQSGYEYAAALLMIQEGLIKEGVDVVEAIRDRYDGSKRNPYAEIECGSSYARSMTSFSLPVVFSGFSCDMTVGKIGFDPKYDGDFRSVWFASDSWGTYERTDAGTVIAVLSGKLSLNRIFLPYLKNADAVICDGKKVKFDFDAASGEILLDSEISDSLIICQ